MLRKKFPEGSLFLRQHILDRGDFDLRMFSAANPVEDVAGLFLAPDLDEPAGTFGNGKQQKQETASAGIASPASIQRHP